MINYKPIMLGGAIPAGNYRVVCAHSLEQVSRMCTRYQHVVAVIIAGPYTGHILHQFLAIYRAEAGWIWEDVVEHPSQVVPGLVYEVAVEQVTYQEEAWMKCGPMKRVEADKPCDEVADRMPPGEYNAESRIVDVDDSGFTQEIWAHGQLVHTQRFSEGGA